jgi:hypothetical protein
MPRRSDSSIRTTTTREAAKILVAHLVPEAADVEQILRARLHCAHNTARARAANVRSCSGRQIYSEAADLAGGLMFNRDARRETLSDGIKIVTWLFLAAGKLERLGAPCD